MTAPTKTQIIGAAIHRDLYQEASDPKARVVEARKLGLGFFVVFCAFFGGISMALNQGTASEPVISIKGAGDAAPVDSASLFVFQWADGRQTPAQYVFNEPIDWKQVEQLSSNASVRGNAVVRVVIDRELSAVLVAPGGMSALKSVRFAGGVDLPAQAGYVYAWENAHLARVIPTRALVLIGAVLGVLCFVPPLGVLIYTGWMGYVARPLAWLNTRLILSLLFFGMFSPMAFVLAIRRMLNPEADALARSLRPKDQSYWLKREIRDRKHFERWF